MGLLESFRPTAEDPWHPPALGMCTCESHVEDLLEEPIPLADGSGSVSVAEVVSSGALVTYPSTPERLFVDIPGTNERRGPYHWRILCEGGLARFYSPAAPVALDDSLFIQPGIERVLWTHGSDIAIGAPKLCARGVQGSLVRALMNPRIRSDA